MAELSAGGRSAVRTKEEAFRASLVFDWLVVFIALFVFTGAFHLHAMLTMGDWDFWIDMKDRRWWVTVTPIMLITFPAALQFILWEKFRLPFGATLAIVALLIGEWLVRWGGWYTWVHFPFSFIFPATILPGALILDMVLLLSRNFILTGIVGGTLFGVLFYPTNWPMIAPYHLPVENYGLLMSLADLIGFEYVRTGTPEYLRLIEAGTLRTFGLNVTPVSAFFSAFVCILVYFLWWFIGKLFSTTRFVRMSWFGHVEKGLSGSY